MKQKVLNKNYRKGFEIGYIEGFNHGIVACSQIHPAYFLCARWNAVSGYRKYYYDFLTNTIMSDTGTGLYYTEDIE